jgi:hypothetical protein
MRSVYRGSLYFVYKNEGILILFFRLPQLLRCPKMQVRIAEACHWHSCACVAATNKNYKEFP